MDFWRPYFPAPQRLRPKYLLSKFHPHTMHIEEIFLLKLAYQIVGALTGLYCTERNDQAFKWFSEPLLVRCCAICQEVLDISKITVTFHEIRPQLFVPARVEQYSISPFFNSACPLSAIPFVSERWGVDAQRFHDNFFTCFAKFQGQYKMPLGLSDGSRNFRKLFPSPEKF